jgi:hypothetical protein
MNVRNAFIVKWMLPMVFGGMLAFVGAGATQAGVIYNSYGFEASPPAPAGKGFVLGALNGQNGWKSYYTTNSDKIIVENSTEYAGNRAMELQADTANVSNLVARQTLSSALTTNHYVDFQFYTTANAKTTFSIRDGSGGSSGTLVVSLDFNAGTIHQGTTDLTGIFTTGKWNRLTLYIEPTDSKFDMYVNGVKTDTGIAMLADGGSHSIQEYEFQRNKRTTNTGSLYIDDFSITDASPIPEPAMLGAVAAGALLLMRRTDRRSA